jgi:hypothetical protein
MGDMVLIIGVLLWNWLWTHGQHAVAQKGMALGGSSAQKQLFCRMTAAAYVYTVAAAAQYNADFIVQSRVHTIVTAAVVHGCSVVEGLCCAR